MSAAFSNSALLAITAKAQSIQKTEWAENELVTTQAEAAQKMPNPKTARSRQSCALKARPMPTASARGFADAATARTA